MNVGVGRCFPFWQEVMACYVVNTSAEDNSGKKKCSPVLEDYYECLHHKKEVGSSAHAMASLQQGGFVQTNVKQHARALAIQAAYARAEAATPRDNAPSAKQIRNLGLLGKEEESREVIGR